MISNRLFALAFEYKKTKLWNKILDTEIFALKMSDGTTGYISVMGAGGSHLAIALYLGDNGINNLRTITDMEEYQESPFQYQEKILSQECLQCVFGNKNELTQKELEETKNYTQIHKIRLFGKNAYPQFIKYLSYRIPCYLQTEQDQNYLCEALSASIALADILKGKNPHMIGLDIIHRESKEILMLEQKDEQYFFSMAELPEVPSINHPVPDITNDINLAKIKRYKKFGIWECEIIRFPKPVESEEGLPFYPIVLLAVETSSDYILPMSPVSDYEKHPEQLMNFLINALLEDKVRPMAIKVRDERTYHFLKPLCDKLKIPFSLIKKMPSLENVEKALWKRLSQNETNELEEILTILDSIMSLEDKYLRELPDFMIQQLDSILEKDDIELPEEVYTKLMLILQKIEQAKQEQEIEKKPNSKKKKAKVVSIIPVQSYVISISLCTGCYRHIQISGRNTLKQLHLAILDAFQLEDNQYHAFFMNNHSWSIQDCYFMEGIQGTNPCTSDYTLDQMGLYQGKSFKYIFDFKNKWIFQCKILRILNNDTDFPIVIRTKGIATNPYNHSEEDDPD